MLAPAALRVTSIGVEEITDQIRSCRLCADRFANTATGHEPRPVAWFSSQARILIAGQAPGMKVHLSGQPFTDPSGDRLRDWMQVDADTFYDRTRIAIVPMAFCFPGYSNTGSDLPPPAVCSKTWRDDVMQSLTEIRLKLVIGGYAMKYHLGKKQPVTEAVRDWASRSDEMFVLPHPSWRNTGWVKKNPWFEADVLPRMRKRIRDVLND